MSNEIGTEKVLEILEQFAQAWNRHDLEALMSFMAKDCQYKASAGPENCGRLYRGHDAVQAGYEKIFATYKDAHWAAAKHFVSGDRAVSEWIFTGTRSDGVKIESIGCDLFTFDSA